TSSSTNPAPPTPQDLLSLRPSPLRPPCPAEDRIFCWRGVNTPPPSMINHPVIHFLTNASNQASLQETTSYGSGLRKFHMFCDIFSVPEAGRLPASFKMLHSFALWAISDPSTAESFLKKYLSAICTWHIAQGWPPPLSPEHFTQINWSLRGMENLQGTCCKLVRPPITLQMLTAIKATLRLDQPFDACIWAMSSCAFFGMMRFGEVAVKTRMSFDKSKHITRKDIFIRVDLAGKPYARLDLP
ncbi:uncharacterized protein EDB91DRAFT_1061829, partial [Suillus paluster]|uniref:uncharacterized protein n=1 Tax=Suillus paluster TaxID=48578 RepID=UPI001B87A8AF